MVDVCVSLNLVKIPFVSSSKELYLLCSALVVSKNGLKHELTKQNFFSTIKLK